METKVVLVNKHGVFEKGCRRRCWCLRVIELDCIRMTIWRLKLSRSTDMESSQREQVTTFVFVSLDLIISG